VDAHDYNYTNPLRTAQDHILSIHAPTGDVLPAKCYDMKKTFLLIFTALPFLAAAQPLFTLPLEKKNPYEQHLFIDNDGFTVAVLEYGPFNMALFLKPGVGKLFEYEIPGAFNKFEGFSSNDRELNMYFTGELKKGKVVTFYKDSKVPEMKDISITGLQQKDKEYFYFTRDNKFYKVFKNNKLNQLSIYEFSGSTGKNIGTFTISENTYKDLEDVSFKYIPEHGNVSLELMIGGKMYWSSDSLIFAYHQHKIDPSKDEHIYVSLNLKKKSVSERVVMTGIKTSNVNDFLLDNKIFLAYTHRTHQKKSSNTHLHPRLAISQYDDSLFVEVLDVQSLRKIKQLKMSPKTGINLKFTPFVSTEGDTLEKKWKPEDKQRKTFIKLSNSLFIQVARNPTGQYVLTLGTQTYYTHTSSPAPGVGGAVGAPSVTTSSSGPQEYFKGCLSETFELTGCDDVVTQQDKAIVRRAGLEKRIVQKGLPSKPYSHFLISCNSQHFYLMYIEKETKTLLIEQF
jgi:hypothetical protein